MEPLASSANPSHGATPEELVDLIDFTNRVIGVATRREVRARNLLHRGVGILCWSSRRELYIHRRTRTKDIFPGMYDMFVGGVVGSGEADLDAARREIAEELGIVGPEPAYLFHHLYLGPLNRAWVAVYEVLWDGPMRHQASEVEWGAFVSLEDLDRKIGSSSATSPQLAEKSRFSAAGEARITEWPFVPDGLRIFERLHLQGFRQSRVGSGPTSSKGGWGGLPPRNR